MQWKSLKKKISVDCQHFRFRTSCVACRECQNAAYTTTVANTEGGQSSGLIKPPKPRAGISIPKKKKRDSLSILKALASTVGKVT